MSSPVRYLNRGTPTVKHTLKCTKIECSRSNGKTRLQDELFSFPKFQLRRNLIHISTLPSPPLLEELNASNFLEVEFLRVPESSTKQRKIAREIFKEHGTRTLDFALKFKNGDWKERSLACFLLGEIGTRNPFKAFASLKEAASDEDWRVREAAATALTEISRRKREDFLREMSKWVENSNPKVRRAGVESLRVIARKEPREIIDIIGKVKTDSNKYVRDAVSHILREATKINPKLVEETCKEWMKKGDKYTCLIVKHGVKKLEPKKQKEILYGAY